MMELEHSFTVPVPPQRAWDVLMDVQRVAPCMPGATLDSVEGDDIKGRIKVKVGPISMTYAGTAHFGERDTDAGIIVLEAAGKETRGAGTASATVRSQLQGENGHTKVVVHTSLNVTGRPAQFGRGVMAEVGGKLIGIFADNLAAMLSADGDADTVGATAAAADGPAPADEPAPAAEAVPAATADDAAASSETESGTPSDVRNQPLDDLDLSLRSYNSLRREGIHTIGELAFRTEPQLLAISNIGRASIVEIKQKLAGCNLSLAATDSAGAPLADDVEAAAAAAGPGASTAPPVRTAPESATPEAAGPGTAGPEAATAAALAESGGPVTEPAAPSLGQAAATPARPRPASPAPAASADLNLIKVAGPAVLKRAAPVLAGVAVVTAVIVRLRRRRRS